MLHLRPPRELGECLFVAGYPRCRPQQREGFSRTTNGWLLAGNVRFVMANISEHCTSKNDRQDIHTVRQSCEPNRTNTRRSCNEKIVNQRRTSGQRCLLWITATICTRSDSMAYTSKYGVCLTTHSRVPSMRPDRPIHGWVGSKWAASAMRWATACAAAGLSFAI